MMQNRKYTDTTRYNRENFHRDRDRKIKSSIKKAIQYLVNKGMRAFRLYHKEENIKFTTNAITYFRQI